VTTAAAAVEFEVPYLTPERFDWDSFLRKEDFDAFYKG
jgi:hypothetical protein